MKELTQIQARLHAPKSNVNKFGGYTYRSAEDILEALKPLLKEQECTLTLNDSIIEVAGRVYVQAQACITNAKNESVTTSAYAREEENKKGMDVAQITGSASSYARKYALNGLFAIDDGRDPDSENRHEKTPESPKAQKLSGQEVRELERLMSETDTQLENVLRFFEVQEIDELPFAKVKKMLEKKKNQKEVA